jgi:hypothetical protein
MKFSSLSQVLDENFAAGTGSPMDFFKSLRVLRVLEISYAFYAFWKFSPRSMIFFWNHASTDASAIRLPANFF